MWQAGNSLTASPLVNSLAGFAREYGGSATRSLAPESRQLRRLGKFEHSNCSFSVGISPYGPFPWQRSLAVYVLFSNAGKFKASVARVPYNKLLTNLANSSRTEEYWPSVVFVQTSLRSVRTATTSGQYPPVRPSRSVSTRLLCFDGNGIFDWYFSKLIRIFLNLLTTLNLIFFWSFTYF